MNVRGSVAASTGPGRHRLGRAGLTHCRSHPGVTKRIDARRAEACNTRRVADDGGPARRFAAVAAVSAITAVLVSGWYAASGASAIAMMLAN
jgi:hypothetical protein